MNIGLDYDDTFTRDPIGWTAVVKLLVSRGHTVMIVTWRDEDEAVEVTCEMNYWQVPVDGIYATDRKAKEKFMYDKGIRIDVWVDDQVGSILHDGR
jgi:hypothetical protein